jgi:hypothetical protein
MKKPSMKIPSPPPLPKEPEPAPPPERRAHVSVYISKRVQREFKQLALDYDKKTQELYLEGMDAVLRTYGRASIAEIDAVKP